MYINIILMQKKKLCDIFSHKKWFLTYELARAVVGFGFRSKERRCEYLRLHVFQLHESAFWENFIKDALDDTVRVGSVSVEELTSWTIHPAAELGFIVCCLETEADIEAFVSAIRSARTKGAQLSLPLLVKTCELAGSLDVSSDFIICLQTVKSASIYSLERTKITPRVSKTVQ